MINNSSKFLNVIYEDACYDILVTKKRVTSLRLKVTQNCEIRLSIPNFYSFSQAQNFLNSKAEWISKNLSKMSEKKIDDACPFTNGSTILIWGIPRTIRITISKYENIELGDNELIMNIKTQDSAYAKKKFLNWAKIYFGEHITKLFNDSYNTYFKKVIPTMPQLVIRPMQSMWGNCRYYQSVIALNFYLLKVPMYCVNYIIIHEIAHILYHDHGEKFKSFLTKNMPCWRQYQKELANYSLRF